MPTTAAPPSSFGVTPARSSPTSTPGSNALHFAGQLPAVPVAIGITTYGGCRGLTRSQPASQAPARITIASNQFTNLGEVSDVVLHEMVHVHLQTTGRDSRHAGQPWCDEIIRISRHYGRDVTAAPPRSKRIGAHVVKVTPDGALSRGELAHWPVSIGGLHDDARALTVDRY